jgi:hypothetical protein
MKTGLSNSIHLSGSMILTTLLLITLIIVSSCSEKAIQVSTPSHVRGDTAYQSDTLEGFTIFPDTRVMLRSIHDNDSLYLEVKIEDRIALRSVLTNGLTVWIDPKAGRNETYGMAFTAARAEMLGRREELLRELEKEEADTAALLRFATHTWVEAVNQREVVVKDLKGTRFADKGVASVSLDENSNLIYNMKFSFSQLDLKPQEVERISIGVISQIHQAQIAGGQQGGISGPPGTGTRSRPQQTTIRPMRLPQVPVNSWIVITMASAKEQTSEVNSPSKPEN